MTPERWEAVQRVFESALACPEPERAAHVAREAPDTEFADLVHGLLAADAVERSEPGGGLADVVTQAVAEVTAANAAPPVERLGPYKLLTMLGEGGMGAVYLAERDDDEFLQRVAIKVVRGLLEPERVRQFRNERQILAWLEHPNIARLLDGGTTDAGLPYFVMEHVDGVPIDQYCDGHRMTIADRLRLFLAVSDGVSHAHRSLIVHRDIKPANILVTAQGVPKLLDFGIARLALDVGPEATTSRGHGRMMTPHYASPEVVRGGQVTTSADVYALGVLLYELVTGRRPLHFATMTSAEVERVVCHVEPPQASAASAAVDSSEPSAEDRAALRRTSSRRLRAQLAGDLDAILAAAIEKDPARRYASVEAFAADVRHHLAGRPVAARPPSWSYTVRRFAARHRWEVGAAALLLAALSGSAIMLSVQATRLAAERDLTARERDTAQQVVSFLTGLFEVSNPDTASGSTITARELLDRGAERIDAELGSQPMVQARLLGTIGTVYGSLGLYERSAALLERGLELRRATLGADHIDTAHSMEALAETYRELARLDEAESLHREALAIKQRRGDTPTSVASSLNNLGLTLAERGRYAEAEPLLRDAIQAWRAAQGASAAVVAVGLNNLAQSLRQQGRLDEAVRVLEEAIAIRRRRVGNQHPLLANVLGHLGQVRSLRGEFEAAEPLLREALAIRRKAYGDEHPDTATSFNSLASLLQDRGDLAGAEPLYRLALVSIQTRLGRRHPEYADQLNNLGSLLEDSGRLGEAEPLFREALAVRRAAFGDEHPAVARALHNLGRAELGLGRVTSAGTLATRALEMRSHLLPAGNAETAQSLALLGGVRAAERRYGDSERLLSEALDAQRKALGATHPAVASTLLALAKVYIRLGRAAPAEHLVREAVTIQSARLPADHWQRAMGEMELASVLAELGRPAEAAPLAKNAASVLATRLGEGDARTRRAAHLVDRVTAALAVS